MTETTTHQVPQPIRNGHGATDNGPRNKQIDLQNPDILVPPDTDSGTLPNLKFSFSQAHMRLEKGGWAREVTQREMPIATTLAGVNMRLKPGAFRELHWHKQSEWAYVLEGKCRISAVDQEGRNFLEDVSAGDLWFFPQGIPHHIQALDEGVEFLLVFNDGNFSENGTFLISDWFAHTPRSILAKNFGVPEEDFSSIPTSELYIFNGRVPPPLESDRILSPTGDVPRSFKHSLDSQAPIRTSGGTARIVDSHNFEASTTTSAALVEIEPGAIRELHWHPNNDEWQYYISGQGRMGVFADSGRNRTFDYQAGDVGYVPFAMGHYIENTGDTPLKFLEMFLAPSFEDVSLAQWMALTPPEVVQQHLNLSDNVMRSIRREKQPIFRP
ncbi:MULTISPECIES: oxalate decarboxylase family bicupin [Streptomyces]|uniref:Oxalate decarboxylase OxdD n=1 Tax=Streptomyces malaysiensis TaxID=92644 RepID=A0A2J7Z222_STRMQ|nr:MULTISPECIES: oxalate decarboxylase family bicupin [Streptomyces]MCD9586652.1 oxalate decarboxylase family bicupin [Streptomyces sp. 8ZJF_21]PNG94335.1 Oxalate decarboxylase OxdD [Streptomyces malaysiensis]WHX23675.1 oxalate decarboxylase family bicupin [Streptomyces sp. NA07423]